MGPDPVLPGVHHALIDEDLEEFPAIIIQHEDDHLDGILFIDKISRLRRTL